MAGPQEVEIKFRISDIAALERKLLAGGFRQKTASTRELNTLYDLPGQTLKARGEILRIREYNGGFKLTHKAKSSDGRHKTRIERETSLDDGVEMDGILRALGYAPTFVYEKFRSEWTDGKGEVVVDRTPIGDMGEIEGSPEWIDSTAGKLGIAQRDYITRSYGDLFEEWRRHTGSQARNMTYAELNVTPPY